MNMENVAKWNVHGEAVRTTNGVEAFHSALSKECPFHHPNIWVFIELLQSQQSYYAARLAKGMKISRQEKARETQLGQLWARLYPEDRNDAPMELMDYLDSVARNLHLELV